MREHGPHLLVHDLVGLAEELAPLGVADDHVADTSSAASIGGEISPVNAPFSSEWTSCAPSAVREPVALDQRLRPRAAR